MEINDGIRFAEMVSTAIDLNVFIYRIISVLVRCYFLFYLVSLLD